MKLRLLSDIHLEFHPDGGERFLSLLPRVECDVTVIAGDLTNFAGLPGALRLVRQKLSGPIVYVEGNHEGYGGSIPEALTVARRELAGLENFYLLERETVTVAGVRIHGASLWFPYLERNRENEKYMTDFYQVRNLREDVGDANAEAHFYLFENVKPSDVVVTHHLPVKQCVHPKYRGSSLNRYFVGEVADVIDNSQPALWLFGHTHESMDLNIGATRLVSNPYGYEDHETNPNFDPFLVIEVPVAEPARS